MSKRQEFLDRVRELQTDLKVRLDQGKFIKEVEKFCVEEALKNLATAVTHLQNFLQNSCCFLLIPVSLLKKLEIS